MFHQWQVSCTLFVLISFINTSAGLNSLWITYMLDAYVLYYILHNVFLNIRQIRYNVVADCLICIPDLN